jgi:hypothetical protein
MYEHPAPPFDERSERVEMASLKQYLMRGGIVSKPRESGELEEATREYVERLKKAYPGINEQDLYELVIQVARRRVEEAES